MCLKFNIIFYVKREYGWMTVATANNNNDNNNDDDRKNIQNTIKVIDVNSYKIWYCDYCSDAGSETKEIKSENCKNIVIILQERSIEEWFWM